MLMRKISSVVSLALAILLLCVGVVSAIHLVEGGADGGCYLTQTFDPATRKIIYACSPGPCQNGQVCNINVQNGVTICICGGPGATLPVGCTGSFDAGPGGQGLTCYNQANRCILPEKCLKNVMPLPPSLQTIPACICQVEIL